MALRRIRVSDFRCLRSAELELDPDFTLISGPNASGKTSFLECVYILGRGRSFRTRRLQNLIRAGSDRFVIFGQIDQPGRLGAMGIEGTSRGMQARLGGDRVGSLVELAAALPVQIIDPEVHRLIEEGPARRRRFLDWGVFHVEHAFAEQWRRYHQVLKQRNAALKTKQPRAVIAPWDAELAPLGNAIHEARKRYVAALSGSAQVIAKALLGQELHISYRSGWLRDTRLEEALRQSWNQDLELGTTHVGPQRADLRIRLDGIAVKDRISRGQQKLLASALLVAQLSLFPKDLQRRPTLLLDDPAAELDGEHLLGLIREVTQQTAQLVVTSLHSDFSHFGRPGRRYVIGEGSIKATD